MSILSNQLDSEQIPLGALGKFIPLWINGWDAGRTTLMDELRKLYAPWDTRTLVGMIYKCYNEHLETPIHNLSIKVATCDKWLVGYQTYLPPHQLITPIINVPYETSVTSKIIKNSFIYTGPKLDVVDGLPFLEDHDTDFISLYESGLMTKFYKELDDKGVTEYMGVESEELYKLYMKGIEHHGSAGR